MRFERVSHVGAASGRSVASGQLAKDGNVVAFWKFGNGSSILILFREAIGEEKEEKEVVFCYFVATKVLLK